MPKISDDIDKFRQEVKTDTYAKTWKEIISDYEANDIIINPDYQRLFRWDLDQQSLFIESVLLGIPIPPLFLAENEDGKFELIDGLQRVSTILKFFSPERCALLPFELNSELAVREQNNIDQPTLLAGGSIVDSLEGFTSFTLPDALKRSIRQARITVVLLERESTKKARYQVFKRLNEYGEVLEAQEIRNCVARLYGDDFPNRLRRLAANREVVSALGLPEEHVRRMRIEELILRILASLLNSAAFKQRLSDFLDEFMIGASEGKFPVTAELEARLVGAFSLVERAFAPGEAFRVKGQNFSSNLYDVLMVGIITNIETLTVETLRQRRDQLVASKDFADVSGPGSNSRRKTLGRIELGKKWLA